MLDLIRFWIFFTMLLNCFLVFALVQSAYCVETIIYPNNSNWLSILSTTQTAGSILTFRAGTYTASSRVGLILNGSPNQPVIIRGYPGERVVFLQQNPNGANAMEVDGSNFMLQNFVLEVKIQKKTCFFFFIINPNNHQ